MSEETPRDVDSSDTANEQVEAAAWLRASIADLAGLDIEAPIAGSATADTQDLSNQFHAVVRTADAATAPLSTPASRVFTMLSSVAGMSLRATEQNEPFGPMVSLADGRRSAILSDFRGEPVELLATMATQVKNPVLRARLADVCWMLDRKRGNMGNLAIGSYVETVEKLDAGELNFRGVTERGALQDGACDYLRRALQIGRVIGWEKPGTVAARRIVKMLRQRANTERSLHPMVLFSRLDLEAGISDPVDVATGLDEVLATASTDANVYAAVELWRLAARAYHLGKRNDDKFRCQATAAERLVIEAEDALNKRKSAMVSAHMLSAAIAEFHGVPGKRDRRTELRHKLIDVQARIPEEMSTISHTMDLRDIAEGVGKIVGEASFLDQFFIVSRLAVSPKAEKLVDEAVEMIRKSPLSSLFGASYHDHEGKVIHRTEGTGTRDGLGESAIKQQIAQCEAMRRQVVAFGQIEVARQTIVNRRYLSDDVFHALFVYSPFVPHNLIATFARGFSRFFQGDFVSATYILTPLLENSLRHVLKSHGHDVTIFDDATQTQQDRSISSMFEEMRGELEKIFTKDIIMDIENVFLSKQGPQLRHSVAHGLLHDGSPYGADAVYGCALIFRLCLHPLYPHRGELPFPFD